MRETNKVATLLLSFFWLCRYALAANIVHISTSRSSPEMNVWRRDHYGSGFKRATSTAVLINNVTTTPGYLVTVEIGTPAQTLSIIIDTGSSDTFVLAQTDDQCNNPGLIYEYGPCIGGTFDPSSSSTLTVVAAGGFQAKYADGSTSSGDYISENLEIGGSLISGLQMGLAFQSTIGVGIMGIGYQTDEAVAPQNLYPNIIDQLVAQKFINLKAYSLYLDDMETSTGSILFGGIDTAKFVGTLKMLPIQNNPDTNTIDAFIVLINSLSITDKSSTSTWMSSTLSLPVVLDSGTTLTYLPSALINEIISQFGAIDDTANSQLIFVDCDWRVTRPNDHLTYTFGSSNDGPVIHVPLSEVIRTIPDGYDYNFDSPFTNTCDLGLRAANVSIYILGDTFLRSAYVVYDLDNNQIALAQTNFETTASSVHEIPVGAQGIPLLQGQVTGMTQVPASHFSTIIVSETSSAPTLLGPTPSADTSVTTTKLSSTSSSLGSNTPTLAHTTSLLFSKTPIIISSLTSTPGSTTTAMPKSTVSSSAQVIASTPASMSTAATVASSSTSAVISPIASTAASSTTSAATSRSAATGPLPVFHIESIIVLSMSILLAFTAGLWFFM